MPSGRPSTRATASLEAARGTPREGQFHPDDRLPFADQAQLVDYRRSGYDRGHMTPSGDMPDEHAQQQTFSLANMVPQTAALNRGVWEEIESAVRDLAARQGELYMTMLQGSARGQHPPVGVCCWSCPGAWCRRPLRDQQPPR